MRRALALGLLAPLAACATVPADRLYPYECGLERTDASGTFRVEHTVARPDSTGVTIASWHTPFGNSNPHVNLGATWIVPDAEAQADAGPPADGDYFLSYYHVAPRPSIRARMELARDTSAFVLVGPTTRIAGAGLRVRVGQLRALASGGGALTVRIVGEDGSVIVSETLEPALLDAAAAAAAAALPEFRAMLADYRTRCSSSADRIVVT